MRRRSPPTRSRTNEARTGGSCCDADRLHRIRFLGTRPPPSRGRRPISRARRGTRTMIAVSGVARAASARPSSPSTSRSSLAQRAGIPHPAGRLRPGARQRRRALAARPEAHASRTVGMRRVLEAKEAIVQAGPAASTSCSDKSGSTQTRSGRDPAFEAAHDARSSGRLAVDCTTSIVLRHRGGHRPERPRDRSARADRERWLSRPPRSQRRSPTRTRYARSSTARGAMPLPDARASTAWSRASKAMRTGSGNLASICRTLPRQQDVTSR